MKLRRKNCLSKIAIIITSIVLISLVLWGNGSSSDIITKEVGSGPLDFYFPNRIASSLINRTKLLTQSAQKCLSSVSNIKITANYTLNNVLDKIKIIFQNGHIDAVDNILPNIHDSTIPQQDSNLGKEPLEVIVIPHSHNDPGWKKTYKKYFDDQTTHILSNMVDKLYEYPDMTFIWVESCFLDMWWQNQTYETKEKFKTLVQSGRLEITSGMWVAPDEASPHYFALLDQMIEGHYWVKKNLGIVPESSLNFDQFGYSSTMPYLAKQAGLKNVLIKRIHRGLKERFGRLQTLNFNWRQFWDPEGKDDIFGHIDTYEWMSISDSCGPDRAVCRGLDFLYMPDLPVPGTKAANKPFRSDHATNFMAQNFHDFTAKLVEQFRHKAANYKYNVIMLPHGGDFRYATPFEWDKQYKNLKVFMKYVNENKKTFNVNMRFGTLKDFFQEVEKQEQIYDLTYPVVSGDFYTYTESTEYWTGYFTTRQFDKRLGREVLEGLRAAELFTALARSDPRFNRLDMEKTILTLLESARKNLGIFQHHDAITGTSQAHVVIDYEQLLSSAFTSVKEVLSTVSRFLLNPNSDRSKGKLIPSLRRTDYNALTKRVSIPVTKSGTKVVLVNSLTQKRHELVSIIVNENDVIILDPKGNEVKFDIIPKTENSIEVKFEVEFPPVSVLVYTVKSRDSMGSRQPNEKNIIKSENIEIFEKLYFCENDIMNVTFNKDNGSPDVICYKNKNFCTKVNLDWRYYRGQGGAYTMMSNGMESTALSGASKVKFVKAETFCSIESQNQYFSFKVSLPLSNSISGKALRVDIVSDLSRASGFVGDLAMRVETSIRSGDVFYVDSNGFQMMGRKFRDSIPFDGNVYPMSAMSMIEDESVRLIVHSAQPHGVVSRASGKIDFMLDRIAVRPEMDLPEGVRDNKPTETVLFIELESSMEFQKLSTTETALPSINSVYLNDVIQHPVYSFFSIDDLVIPNPNQSFLNNNLPCDVIFANVKNLLDDTSKPEGTSLTLFRRAIGCKGNIKDNFCELHDPVNLHPGSLLKAKFNTITEMSLSHLIPKDDLKETDLVSLEPMGIKTFHMH